ncbi:legumain-like [Panonychus citri]|uniref:legumain-like n=1 Tax=Panonychus citri TaxID=50023 RepID=UPI00230708A7|nr:legumain-like [Panonychus citri]
MKLLLSGLVIVLIAINLSSSVSIDLNAQLKTNEAFNIHAVLVAGSSGFGNYRHQADVCHAYQLLRSHGVPAENIIVMMYDDIANNKENPYPGQIFNVPKGPNVYSGVSKDYTGHEVTPENFIKVLKGDKELAAKGKKVLTSGPNDHVFIYFSDHGATGLVAFPSSTLSSHQLNEALVYMHDNRLYGKLTFYLEACESGSMFANILPSNISVFATTAANPDESSYATFCDQPDIMTCLADEYSVAWILDSESNDLTHETLETQFKNVVKSVRNSSPQEYGSKDLGSLDVGQFQGESNKLDSRSKFIKTSGSINSRDVPLVNLKRRLASNGSNDTKEVQSKLSTLVSGRRFYDRSIRQVIDELCTNGFCSHVSDVLSIRLPLIDHKSYSIVTKAFETDCINLGTHSYGLKYMYAFANIVQSNNFDSSELERFTLRLQKACLNHLTGHGFESIV